VQAPAPDEGIYGMLREEQQIDGKPGFGRVFLLVMRHLERTTPKNHSRIICCQTVYPLNPV